jgi:hypothetical protein
MKSITLFGRLTTGVVLSGLLMLGISSCTDENVAAPAAPTTKPVEVVTTITTSTAANQTAPVQNAITNANTATLATNGFVMPSLPAGTVVTPTLTSNLTNSVVVPALTFTAPAGSSLALNTSNVGANNIGFQLNSNVGTTGGSVNMSTGNNIIPVTGAANGSSITTNSQVVVPVGINSLTYGAISGGNFVAGNNTNSIAPIELIEEASALSVTRAVSRSRIFLTGVIIRFNNMTVAGAGLAEVTNLPASQAWVIAREENTGVGTTLGSKLTLLFNNTTNKAPADGKVKLTMYFFNAYTQLTATKVKTVNVVGNKAVITDDAGTYPQFTHFAFDLDLRNVKN